MFNSQTWTHNVMPATPIRCIHGRVISWSGTARPGERLPAIEYCAECFPYSTPLTGKFRDAGQVSLRLLLMIVAIVCLVIFTLAAHGSITTDEGFTWLGAGLVFWAIAEVVP